MHSPTIATLPQLLGGAAAARRRPRRNSAERRLRLRLHGRKTDGTRIAVKVQPASSASAAAEEARLHRLAVAPHDNLVALLQPPLVADGYHHLVITLCDRDLVDLLADFGAVPELRARDLIGQAAAGVRHLHMLGIAHRDLKLENLMLVGATVKLIDFGLSSDRGPGALLSDVVGSLAYCAPEVLNIDVARRLGEPPPPGYDGFAADVWSLGICLFALTVGFFLFEAATGARTTDAVGADYRFQRAAIAQAAEPPDSAVRAIFAVYGRARFLSRSRSSTCWIRCSQSSLLDAPLSPPPPPPPGSHPRCRRARRARRAGRAGHAASSTAGRAGRSAGACDARDRRARAGRRGDGGSRRSDARRRSGGRRGGGGTPLPTVAEQLSALSLVPAHLLASFDDSEGEISETSSMEASPAHCGAPRWARRAESVVRTTTTTSCTARAWASRCRRPSGGVMRGERLGNDNTIPLAHLNISAAFATTIGAISRASPVSHFISTTTSETSARLLALPSYSAS